MARDNEYVIWDFPDLYEFETLEEAKEFVSKGRYHNDGEVIIYKAYLTFEGKEEHE